jgi:hypothetical protein
MIRLSARRLGDLVREHLLCATPAGNLFDYLLEVPQILHSRTPKVGKWTFDFPKLVSEEPFFLLARNITGLD